MARRLEWERPSFVFAAVSLTLTFVEQTSHGEQICQSTDKIVPRAKRIRPCPARPPFGACLNRGGPFAVRRIAQARIGLGPAAQNDETRAGTDIDCARAAADPRMRNSLVARRSNLNRRP